MSGVWAISWSRLNSVRIGGLVCSASRMMTPDEGVNVEFTYAFTKFRCQNLVADDADHFFIVQEPQDFGDDALDGFYVVLVGVEGFAEELRRCLLRCGRSLRRWWIGRGCG